MAIALYAAMLSRRALSWQQRRDAERAATRLLVDFEHSAEPMPVSDGGGGQVVSDDGPIEYVLTFVVYNAGETTEWLTDLFVAQADGDVGFHVEEFHPDRRILPRERVAVRLPVARLGFEVAGGVVGEARLASGSVERSEVTHLIDDLARHVEEHNGRGTHDAHHE